jgi:hypothetical protein
VEVVLDDAATVRGDPPSRLAPVVVGGGLAAAAVYTAVRNPATDGGFIPCPFHATTGLWCPGCGLTRGVHALLTGHPLAALGENVFTPLAVVGILVVWWAWLRRAWARSTWRPSLGAAASVTLAALLVLYGVLRNLPGLGALAP